MTTGTTQLGKSTGNDRFRQRVESLGVAVGDLLPDGRLTLFSKPSRLEKQLAESALFGAAARQAWPELSARPGRPVAVWPGAWFVQLAGERRARRGPEQQAIRVALLLSSEFTTSEQFVRFCDTCHLDATAAAAQIDRAGLVGGREVERLASLLSWLQQDAADLDRGSEEVQQISTQLGESYEELSLLYKFSTSMTVNQPPAQFLTEACMELQQVLGLRWMGLQLIDDDPRLNELAGRVFTSGPVGCDEDALKRIGKALMLAQPVGSSSMVVDDTATLHIPGLPQIARHLLVVSLLREDKPLGILFGGDKLDQSHISSVDSKLCNSLANSLSIFLENMMLYEDMQAMFLGTLHALTSSIDAKDSYTHGHSERVATLSRELAVAAGLDDHSVERIYIAGLIHDVGKIGVPESVLCKPGKLTDDEFKLIRMHPEIGARILQDIRQMQDLIPGVLHHHERWDGRGYPYGLKGTDIPLFGRVICLADSFDAMSSNRTYRQQLTHEHVLAEIARCAGTQFDPDLTKLFLQLDFEPFKRLIVKHQAVPQPGKENKP